MDAVSKIARAVLYEGYILWPYRRSALKNRQRWTFGGVFPPAWTEQHPDDPSLLRCQCLVEGPASARVEISLRFLHVIWRQALEAVGDELVAVDALEVDGTRHLTWEEARERDVTLPPMALCSQTTQRIAFAADRELEPLVRADGSRAGAIMRSWSTLGGSVEAHADPVEPDLHRLTILVRNATAFRAGDRTQALRHAFVSTHLALTVDGGAFVSLTDPPPRHAATAAACENVGTWPVLVGADNDRSTMLAAPIILSDHPEIAPESPGDLFDGGEIDQLLVLNILSLSDAEKDEMRASDPKAREILDRCAELSRDELMRLHGAIREFGPAGSR